MANPRGDTTAKMNSLVVYWCGTVYFIIEAAYHWFGQHNAIKALGDLLGAVIGLFLVWYGGYIWGSLKRAFDGRRTPKA